MISKEVAFYGNLTAQTPFNSDQLLVEISSTHIAAVLKLAATNSIGAFELFHFDNLETNWLNIFYQVRNESKILNRGYIDTKVYYHFPQFVLVPAKYNQEQAKVFFESFHGAKATDVIKFESIPQTQSFYITYAIQKSLNDMVNGNMMMVSAKSSYAAIVNQLLHPNRPFTSQLVKLVVYHQFVTIAICVNGQLLFIQSFEAKTPEDILYHLINSVQMHQIVIESSVLELSGFIDVKSLLMDYLKKVFPNIHFEKLDETKQFHTDLAKYDEHVLTPYFNLV